MSADDFTRSTTGFWQELVTAASLAASTSFSLTPPYRYGVPVQLPDGRYLMLPIRQIAGQEGHAVASLIANQASFNVVRTLSVMMAELARPFAQVLVRRCALDAGAVLNDAGRRQAHFSRPESACLAQRPARGTDRR